jgi:radical SAM-linked protein
VSFHDPQMALVETLITRGDRRVGRVIEKVFRNGARFEGWSDRFNFQLWEDALKTEGLDWNCFTAEIGENVRLPWHHLKTGISQIFFHDEWRNSQNGIITPDCRTICSQCGLECAPPPNTKPLTLPLSPKITAELPKTIYRWRFKYSRKGAVSYISHLENVKLLERAFRRAGIPICYSRGFHPHPRFSFGFPLPLGYEARADYFDAYLSEKSANYSAKLNRVLPSGMKFISDREVSAEEPSLFQALNAISYEVRLLGEKPNETLIKDWLVSKEADIFRYILNLNYQKRIFTFTVRLVSGRHLRPENLLLAINYPTWQAKVIRLDCFTIQDLKT